MEQDHGKGAIKSPYDIRDYWYKAVGAGAFDWQTGYDIEEVIGRDLTTKDQAKSLSCGGQAWSYYGEVLEAVATNTYEPQSARWIYSHTAVPGGGSAGRDNSDFVIKNGYVREADASSYDNGNPPSEAFMRTIPELSQEANEIRDISRAASYLQVKPTFELIAQAVQQNHGAIILVSGEDNGTWRSKFPKVGKQDWNHWLYVGKLKRFNGKNYLGVKNSWGNVGTNGWQYLGEEWTENIIECWTLQWDYEAPAHKKALQQIIALLEQLIALYTQLLSKKKTT